jgi:hypothetical protein
MQNQHTHLWCKSVVNRDDNGLYMLANSTTQKVVSIKTAKNKSTSVVENYAWEGSLSFGCVNSQLDVVLVCTLKESLGNTANFSHGDSPLNLVPDSSHLVA